MPSLRLLTGLIFVAGMLTSGCSPNTDPSNSKAQKFIALTLDDGPMTHFYSYPDDQLRWDTVTRLMQQLKSEQVPATIFAIGREMEIPQMRSMLYKWASGGFEIGNHTYSHVSFNAFDETSWQTDVRRANEAIAPVIQAFQPQIRYFRYPFLQEGATSDLEEIGRRVVEREGMRVAEVTIGTDDWNFNEQYMALELKQDWAARYEVGQAYLQHIRKAVAYWDSVGTTLAGRPIHHVMMLHCNRINRDYLAQIIQELKKQGFDFISLDRALQDSIYQEEEDWATENGVSFLEHIKQNRMKRGIPLHGKSP